MSAPPPFPAAASRLAWRVVALLFPVALLNYLDRQLLASMKLSVMRDVAGFASEADWGRMLGQFKWVYAFLSPIGGYLADRFGRRYTICGSLLAWSAVTWWTGHVSTYSETLAARTLMGLSEALYIPAALALIADHHPAGTRSRAVGLHQFGIYAGVILGGFSGYAAESPSLGWRWTFDVCGWFGLLYALPLFLGLREAPRAVGAGSSPSPVAAARALLSSASFLLLVFYFTLPALAAWIVRDWMPAILQSEFHIGQGLAGVSATLYWQVAAIAGALGGGWLADRWLRRAVRGRLYASALGVGLMVPAIFGVGYAPQTGLLWVAIVFLVLFGLGWGFFDANNMPILSQIARPELRATGYGLMNFVSISGGGVADWGFGALRDRHVPFGGICTIFAGAALVSIVLVLLIRLRPAPSAAAASA